MNYSMNQKYYIGVDIGGTNVRTVFATDSEYLLKIVQPTRKTGPDTTLVSQVIQMIESGLSTLNIHKGEIYGIGTSSAGPFVDGGTKIWTPNISGVGNDWKGVPYIKPLREYFGPNCILGLANDCVSSVKAEQLFGAGQGYSNLVYVTISTGVGGGIIVNNHLLKGKSKNAGHVGHLIVKKDGPLCGCGQHGCIESIASGRAIVRRAKEQGIKLENGKGLTTKDVFDLYHQGNAKAQELIHETIEYLGIMFSDIISIADPEIIIIGGSVFIYNQDLLLPKIISYVKDNSFAQISKGVKFVPSQLKEFVGDLAGLSLIFPSEVISKWQQLQPWRKKIKIKDQVVDKVN